MHVHVIDDFDGFAEIRSDWDAVYAADPEAQFFLSWQWMADWLACHQTIWFVLAAKRRMSDAHYCAFLPIRMRTGFDAAVGFYNQLYFAGDGFSDYAGILTLPEAEAAAVPAFAEYVKRKLDWARFTMENLLMSEPRRRLFLAAFDKLRFVHKDIDYFDRSAGVDNGLCLTIDLPGDWDSYLETLSANNRQKIRRLLRKVESSDNYRIAFSPPEHVERDLQTLLSFWRTKWAPRKGARTEPIIDRNYRMLVRCAANGTLLLPVFWHGDRPVAALAILKDEVKRSQLFFITGRDETFVDLPAGYLLQAFSIRHAIAEGTRAYHFLKGDEPYKYLFAPRERRLRALSVTTKSRRNLSGKLDPRGLPTMLQTALELEEKGELLVAERAYREILELAPDDGLALYRYGRFLAKRRDFAGAKMWLLRSTIAAPEGDNAWLWLARTQHALGDDVAAQESCREALRLTPDKPGARQLILELRPAASSARPIEALWRPVKQPRRSPLLASDEPLIDPAVVLGQLSNPAKSPLGSKSKP